MENAVIKRWAFLSNGSIKLVLLAPAVVGAVIAVVLVVGVFVIKVELSAAVVVSVGVHGLAYGPHQAHWLAADP